MLVTGHFTACTRACLTLPCCPCCPANKPLAISPFAQELSWLAAGSTGNTNRSNMQPPADIHRALLSLLEGRPQPALVPLLATRQAPCVQRTIDLIELFTFHSESNAACSRILAQATLNDDGVIDQSSGFRSSSSAELAKAALQEGAQQLVLAMVDKVGAQFPHIELEMLCCCTGCQCDAS